MSSLPPPPPGSGMSAPPPPPPGIGSTSFTAEPYLRVGRLSRVIMVLLGIIVAFQIISIPVNLALHRQAQKFLDGRISASRFDHALTNAQGTLGFQGGAQLAVAVLTIIWMYRLAVNHRSLGRPGSTWAPGWAIGGWFVPPGFVLAVPWLMLKELWKGSDPTVGREDPTWKQRAVTPLLHVWWITFGFGVPISGAVAGGAIGVNVSFSNLAKRTLADDAKSYTDLIGWQFASTACTIVAALCFLSIVRELTERQRSLTGGQ